MKKHKVHAETDTHFIVSTDGKPPYRVLKAGLAPKLYDTIRGFADGTDGSLKDSFNDSSPDSDIRGGTDSQGEYISPSSDFQNPNAPGNLTPEQIEALDQGTAPASGNLVSTAPQAKTQVVAAPVVVDAAPQPTDGVLLRPNRTPVVPAPAPIQPVYTEPAPPTSPTGLAQQPAYQAPSNSVLQAAQDPKVAQALQSYLTADSTNRKNPSPANSQAANDAYNAFIAAQAGPELPPTPPGMANYSADTEAQQQANTRTADMQSQGMTEQQKLVNAQSNANVIRQQNLANITDTLARNTTHLATQLSSKTIDPKDFWDGQVVQRSDGTIVYDTPDGRMEMDPKTGGPVMVKDWNGTSHIKSQPMRDASTGRSLAQKIAIGVAMIAGGAPAIKGVVDTINRGIDAQKFDKEIGTTLVGRMNESIKNIPVAEGLVRDQSYAVLQQQLKDVELGTQSQTVKSNAQAANAILAQTKAENLADVTKKLQAVNALNPEGEVAANIKLQGAQARQAGATATSTDLNSFSAAYGNWFLKYQADPDTAGPPPVPPGTPQFSAPPPATQARPGRSAPQSAPQPAAAQPAQGSAQPAAPKQSIRSALGSLHFDPSAMAGLRNTKPELAASQIPSPWEPDQYFAANGIGDPKAVIQPMLVLTAAQQALRKGVALLANPKMRVGLTDPAEQKELRRTSDNLASIEPVQKEINTAMAKLVGPGAPSEANLGIEAAQIPDFTSPLESDSALARKLGQLMVRVDAGTDNIIGAHAAGFKKEVPHSLFPKRDWDIIDALSNGKKPSDAQNVPSQKTPAKPRPIIR